MTGANRELSGLEALLSGALFANQDGCVVANTIGGSVTLVWPDGYAVRGNAESFEVVDATGTVIASSAAGLGIGGGQGSLEDALGNTDCVSGDVWIVGAIREG